MGLVQHWNTQSREVEESQSLEVFTGKADKHLPGVVSTKTVLLF